jgi:hypothetical protein
MTRDVEHREGDAELRDRHRIALGDRMGERRDGFVLWSIHRHAIFFQKLRDAADVVGMVMRGEDRGELELLALQIVEHRPRLAGIHHRGVRRVAQRPDVVVLERSDRNHIEHASTLRTERGAEV